MPYHTYIRCIGTRVCKDFHKTRTVRRPPRTRALCALHAHLHMYDVMLHAVYRRMAVVGQRERTHRITQRKALCALAKALVLFCSARWYRQFGRRSVCRAVKHYASRICAQQCTKYIAVAPPQQPPRQQPNKQRGARMQGTQRELCTRFTRTHCRILAQNSRLMNEVRPEWRRSQCVAI